MNDHLMCSFIRFGLIVTGVGEERALPGLFRALAATGLCHVQVLCRINQRSPRKVSNLPRPTVIGTRKAIPDKDFEEIGAPARKFLNAGRCHFVLLIDDLEHGRRPIAAQVFDRYRSALDQALDDAQQGRASVHFLTPMLEAYYFAHTAVVNSVLLLATPLADYDGDVEQMRHPKGDLKQLAPGFDEVEHGAQILARLELDHILASPTTCAALRGMIAWCVAALRCHRDATLHRLETRFCLADGVIDEQARHQLAAIQCPPAPQRF